MVCDAIVLTCYEVLRGVVYDSCVVSYELFTRLVLIRVVYGLISVRCVVFVFVFMCCCVV